MNSDNDINTNTDTVINNINDTKSKVDSMIYDEIMKKVFGYLSINYDVTVRGKVLEYLFRYRSEHYQALEDAGLLKNKLLS